VDSTRRHAAPTGPRSRRDHRRHLLRDRHAWATLGVAGAACVASLGLVYGFHVIHVLRTARRAAVSPAGPGCLLVLGEHAPGGRSEPDTPTGQSRAGARQRPRNDSASR
jgi:hypothetical protein